MTGLSGQLLLRAVVQCGEDKASAINGRLRGRWGIGVDKDDHARWYQRRDRQLRKFTSVLEEKLEQWEGQRE